ncbi:MAG TPA: 3-isopropylmalate dehydrogenase [Candidatus Polarisedimenticolaceae bacterium]|nr:3-isopropylmalate dehydrogenase [Candidatus Polarisedimenticolaceae bacterium]
MTTIKRRFAILPGDGIGVDVTREAVKVLQAASALERFELELAHFDYGAERFLRTGEGLPDSALETLRGFDAIFMGAFGDPRIPDMRHAREILLGTRFRLDLYVNLRPVRCLHDRLCPLRRYTAADIDLVVFRENTEGLYVGMGGIFKAGTPDEIAVQEDVNTRKGVERIIRAAFAHARGRKRQRLTMCDKSNALRYGHDLWQRVFALVAAEYADVEANHLYVDALAMQLIKDPRQFDVIVTCNMFGDIITDLAAQLQGGLGMAASGNLHPGRTSMFEPVHGSAPKYAGSDRANPFAAVLTAAMMLEQAGLTASAARIERAVTACLEAEECTSDVGGKLGTAATGDAVVRRMERG